MNRQTMVALAVISTSVALASPVWAQLGSVTRSNETTRSNTTGQSQSTTTTQTRQSGWGNNTVTETHSQTTGTSSSRTDSTTRGTSVTTPTWNAGAAAPRQGGNDTAAAVGALIGVIGAIAEEREARNAPRIQPEEAYGAWVASASSWSGTSTCSVELKSEKAFLNQGFKLKSEKCWSSPYGQLFAWRPIDGAVTLIKHDGKPLATLRGDANRLSGRTADGVQLVLHRPGY